MRKPTLEAIKLSGVVQTGTRFGRSVNLERDFYDQVSLDGYVLTTTTRDALGRLAQAYANANASRAWTVTGAYGSGKSAFALFAAKTLNPTGNGDAQRARDLIKQHDKELWQSLFDRRRKNAIGGEGLCPVLVSGSREPISRALLRGMATSIERFWVRTPPPLLAEVKQLLALAERGENIQGRQIVELLQEMARKVASSHRAGGLFIIVDELGKLLEYSAAHPHRSDIFILQEIAEATKRSTEHTILLITILHQAFDRYVERLGRTQKEEWTKVQGRFEDIAFQEPTDQLLRVLSHAIRHHGSDPHAEALKRYGMRLARRASELGLLTHTGNRSEEIEVLAECAPLHPTVSLLLGHFFRRIGQNERSLFAFLTSREPHGFQEFISETVWRREVPPTLRLDRLYDYATTSLGNALYAQADGKKWAEIDSALNRLTSPTEVEIRLIKTIGVLRIVGDVGGLKSSAAILEFALEDEETNPNHIKAALAKLRQHQIVLYRRFNDTFALWEGSDINIESLLKRARGQIDPSESLATSLTKYFRPRPLVARRHSQQTGTLRYFDVRYVDLNGLEDAISDPLGDADGRILYAITLNVDEVVSITNRAVAADMAGHPQLIVAVPRETSGLREAIYEVACLRWAQEHTPELEGDRAARSELQSRLSRAEGVVEQILLSFLDPSEMSAGCTWYRRGDRINVSSERALQEYLSDVCDEVFHKSPTLHNELINRRQISSSASSARRELISAMLTSSDRPALGIEGFPPHISMYFSVLQETGLHRENNGHYGFFPPPRTAEPGIRYAWKAIDDFLTETEVERGTVMDLFAVLSQPPYGIKAGSLPVLLCAALLHFDAEVALYEQGSFVPSLSIAVFERLMKAPEKFHLQRCRIVGVRARVFERFAEALLQKGEFQKTEKLSLLTVVRPLTRFAIGLPNYTKFTQRLTPAALRVRNVLFEAREPDKLLFRQLPEACGFAPFTINDRRPTKAVDSFFKCLRGSLAELQRAYDHLLGELEARLIAAFSLKGTGAASRNEIVGRARPLLDLTVDPKLKGFLIRVLDDDLDLVGWIEGVATLLASKPPASWNDTDLARYEVNLAEFARGFRHIESLSFELSKRGGSRHNAGEMLRLGITALKEPELQRVVCISEQESPLVERAQETVERALAAAGLNGNVELRLAALAKVSLKLLQQLEEDEQRKLNRRAAKRS